MSCILDFLLYDVTQRAEINNKQWRTSRSITDFANKQVIFLPTEWMTTCFEQRCHFLFKTYYLLNLEHVLLSVVLQNDGEINVIDHARVVKTFRDPLSSLSDY